MATILCKQCDDQMSGPCTDIVALFRTHSEFASLPRIRDVDDTQCTELRRRIQSLLQKLKANGLPLIEEEVNIAIVSRETNRSRQFTMECKNGHRNIYTLNCE